MLTLLFEIKLSDTLFYINSYLTFTNIFNSSYEVFVSPHYFKVTLALLRLEEIKNLEDLK